ncbi:MAG: phenylalanyl-tRNA synthetase beta chain [Patescibacteria group bacterium]|nr:phenylalanine--tRNA ligase subunit beta [Candidatus Saccharibacteria bacterium]MDQ5963670.1 phenylalanyl-tRNA synthetase beta chain [Patescibacteria group bacterium]
MKVSVNQVNKLMRLDGSTDELLQKINAQLGQVEAVIDLAKKYRDVVIVKVVKVSKHPDADRLNICLVDDSGAWPEVERNDDGLVQVVCGAPNVSEGMYAAWLPPGSTVPASFDDSEPFVLSARELRGVLSQGMLAAADELALGNDHDGIVEISPDEYLPSDEKITPGARFAKVFGLDDTIIDIENKMLTHRPDCFGQLGIARELAGIMGQKFESPEWYLQRAVFESRNDMKIEVFNDCPNLAPRFMAVVMRNVEVKPSPLWLQCALVAMGGKPINNIVDTTNFIMLLTAQPTHAYDYDKLRGGKLGVRMANDGESVRLLNGKTYTFTADDIVIADAEGPVGLAGVMGGNTSEVSQSTKTIVLECASFDMYAVRRSSMRHGLFTDALARFNKGQSPLQNPRVLRELMRMLTEFAGGEQASDVYDLTSEKIAGQIESDEVALPLSVNLQKIRTMLGYDMPKTDMVSLLGNVEFPLCEDCGWSPEDPEDNRDDLHVNMPFWRTDIAIDEDVIEELGRLRGYDVLPQALPVRTVRPVVKNQKLAIKQRVREALSRAGANELLTYSFVHEKTFQRAGQDATQAFRLSNALSPELQYFRLSVLPSLLDKVHANIKAGYDEFVLFEIGKGHNQRYHANDDNGLPKELEFVDAVYASKNPRDGAAYYHIRALVDSLCSSLGIELVYKPLEEPLDFPVTAPFNQQRSALIETPSGVFIGMIGELRQMVRKGFKLPDYSAAMTLDLDGLVRASEQAEKPYHPLSRYPSISQDISLKVQTSVQYQDVYQVASQALDESGHDNLRVELSGRGVYWPEDSDHKTITLRVKITDTQKTLKDSEVTPLLDAVADAAAVKFSAERA